MEKKLLDLRGDSERNGLVNKKKEMLHMATAKENQGGHGFNRLIVPLYESTDQPNVDVQMITISTRTAYQNEDVKYTESKFANESNDLTDCIDRFAKKGSRGSSIAKRKFLQVLKAIFSSILGQDIDQSRLATPKLIRLIEELRKRLYTQSADQKRYLEYLNLTYLRGKMSITECAMYIKEVCLLSLEKESMSTSTIDHKSSNDLSLKKMIYTIFDRYSFEMEE